MTIAYNTTLDDLTGLSSLSSTIRNLFIHDNLDVVNLDGLGGIQGIKAKLGVLRNPNLRSIEVLSSVKEMPSEEVVISGNPALRDLKGLVHLSGPLQKLDISSNEMFKNLAGLNALKEVGKLIITGNANLESIQELRSLEEPPGEIMLKGNPKLEVPEGLGQHDSAG